MRRYLRAAERLKSLRRVTMPQTPRPLRQAGHLRVSALAGLLALLAALLYVLERKGVLPQGVLPEEMR